jgi:hypothetical protein
MLTHTVRGRKVVTIEGLADPDGTLHPVQRSVIDDVESGLSNLRGHRECLRSSIAAGFVRRCDVQ